MYPIDIDEIEDYEDFRAELAGCFIQSIRPEKKAERIAEGSNYEFLLKVRMDIFNTIIPLSEIINDCKIFKPNTTESGHEIVSALLSELISEAENIKYSKFIEEDAQKTKPTTSLTSAKLEDSVPTGKIQFKLYSQMTQLDKPDVLKDEMVQVLQYEFHQSNPKYNGVFVNGEELMRVDPLSIEESDPLLRLEILNELHTEALAAGIDKLISESTGDRLQVIIRNGVHYTTLDIDKERSSCLILDAVGDFRANRIQKITQYSSYIKQVIDVKPVKIDRLDKVSVEHIQKDEYSCPLFALDMSLVVSGYDNIHEHLAKIATPNSEKGGLDVTWFDLPPDLIKLCQSTTILEKYMEKNPTACTELLELTNNNEKGFALKQLESSFVKIIGDFIEPTKEEDLELILKGTVESHSPSLKTDLI